MYAVYRCGFLNEVRIKDVSCLKFHMSRAEAQRDKGQNVDVNVLSFFFPKRSINLVMSPWIWRICHMCHLSFSHSNSYEKRMLWNTLLNYYLLG